MELSLSKNICRLRKERQMTQEQLAEALGVSFAAVSKWERGAATPELSLIADMADFFSVSMDALVGFSFRDNQKDTVVQRLKDAVHDRESKDALSEAEKALKRYPNCFEIVYYSAANYYVRAIYQRRPDYAKQALELYRRACLLIHQNTDPEISETDLWQEMATLYVMLGQPEKGVELLKAHNPCRVNHPLIGFTLAADCDDPEAAAPYLSYGMLDLSATHMQIVLGYINCYFKAKNYKEGLAVLQWALAFYPGLKKPGEVSHMDKQEAALWVLCGYVHWMMGESEESKTALRRAKALAEQFDRAPTYGVKGFRFILPDTAASIVDDLGETALEGIEKTVVSLEEDAFCRLWREILDES